MKIIDKFIDDKSFKNLNETMLGVEFPWYYNTFKVSTESTIEDNENFQFTHIFFSEKKIRTKEKEWNLIVPIIQKLKVKELIKIKANMTPKKNKNYKYPMHVDTGLKGHKTSVFYVNTNNGGTIFQNGKKITSTNNRLVEFDSHQKHAAVDCTDQKVRVVINFNNLVIK